ncbi:MAG: AMP-dependent synthetase, partial [Kineosporiaceae bacterium]
MSELAASDSTAAFRAARDLLLTLREDARAARDAFRWPRPQRFNYARDWFDVVAAGDAGERAALWI